MLDVQILAAIFVSPLFALAGLGLVSVPILIHLLNRRRYKVVNWAAMNFLLAAMKKNRRRLQFEQWLLLATRCAVLGLLGIALARPLACSGGGMLSGGAVGRNGLCVIVLDNSHSMSYEAPRGGGVRTHLDQAKLLARQTVERLSTGGEAVAIVSAARPATVVLPPTYDLSAAVAAIERVEPTFAGTDLPGALRGALEIGRENARLPFRQLVILTDATRPAWEPSAGVEELARLGPELATLFRIRHFNLSRPDQWNAAVLEVAPAAPLIRSGFDSSLTAVARSFGRAVEGRLNWSIDRRSLPVGAAVTLAPDTPPVTQSQARFGDGGAHVVTVSAPVEDRLPADDVRHRVVEVASAMRVLIVEGERGVGPLAGSAAFLELALAPPTDLAAGVASLRRSSSYVVPEVISDLELGNRVLADYRAVVLAGVGPLTATHGDQLKRFVEDGGTLVLFMGEPVAGENYNQVLLPRGLMPGALSKRLSVATDQKGFTFDFNPQGALHPLLKVFAGEENSGLETAQVFTYWQADVATDGKVERVLDFAPRPAAPGAADGQRDPAITLHALGGGRVVFVATTANADWTSLPAKPAYVALVHELLANSVSSGDGWMNLVVGQSLELPPGLPLSAAPVLRDGAQHEVPLMQATRGDGRILHRSPPLSRPGVYALATGSATLPVVVNLPPEEADIRPLDERALGAALGGASVEFVGDVFPADAERDLAGNDLGWMVMLAVLALVGLESLMAMRFGHYRR